METKTIQFLVSITVPATKLVIVTPERLQTAVLTGFGSAIKKVVAFELEETFFEGRRGKEIFQSTEMPVRHSRNISVAMSALVKK